MTVAVVAAGGALGAVARYLASAWVQDLAGSPFPWGTFAVNVIGSFVLGFSLVWLQTAVSSTEVRQFVAIGFLGSFTTFSTYSYEALTLARAGDWWRAGGYTVGSVALGVLGVGMGAGLALVMTGSRG